MAGGRTCCCCTKAWAVSPCGGISRTNWRPPPAVASSGRAPVTAVPSLTPKRRVPSPSSPRTPLSKPKRWPVFRDWNIETCLPKIRCPVLAIQGEGDEYATMRQIDVIAEQVPGAQLLKLPDCGHAPHKDQESIVLAALAEFVGSL